MNPFRIYHIESLLEHASPKMPLDVQLKNYFKSHKAIGSKDRKVIAETVYGFERWKALIEHAGKGKSIREKISIFTKLQEQKFSNTFSASPHVAVSFPKYLYNEILTAYGSESETIFRTLNEQAPPTIRANPLKTTRKKLLSLLEEYGAKPTEHAPHGITFPKRENFFGMKAFQDGLFEMQDEGSQLVADLVDPKPGDHVLDYCAGSGGKTLAFAHKLKGKGQIYLYDIRDHALVDAKKRLKRAGIQNAQILSKDRLKKRGLQKRMDWLLLDVPCSGTGTLRRNPDMKWRITKEGIEELTNMQRDIFEASYSLVHPRGYIVYATCSILPQENEAQVDFFLKKYNIALVKKPLKILPEHEGMDGFFGAVFKKLEDDS